MTVTAIDTRRHASGLKSDDGRLLLTAGQLLARAYALIDRYGHYAGDGFGSPATGFALTGAVYRSAGFYVSDQELANPVLCAAHRRQDGPLRQLCERDCEMPLWVQCNQAFTLLSEAVRTAPDEQLVLRHLQPCARDFGRVVEASETLDTTSALRLIARVLRVLGVAPVRLQAPTAGAA